MCRASAVLCVFWSQLEPVCVLGPAELGPCFPNRTTWPRSLQDLSPPRSDMLVMNTQTQQRMTHIVQLPAGLPHLEGIVCSLGPGRSQLLPLLLHQHLVVSLQCSTPVRLPSNPSQDSWDRSGFACCCQSFQRKASYSSGASAAGSFSVSPRHKRQNTAPLAYRTGQELGTQV